MNVAIFSWATIIGVFVIMISPLLVWRNNLVFAQRSQVINEISRLTHMNIDKFRIGMDLSKLTDTAQLWRYGAFEAGPSYGEMLWKFWKPVKSFYNGAIFLDPAISERPVSPS